MKGNVEMTCLRQCHSGRINFKRIKLYKTGSHELKLKRVSCTNRTVRLYRDLASKYGANTLNPMLWVLVLPLFRGRIRRGFGLMGWRSIDKDKFVPGGLGCV